MAKTINPNTDMPVSTAADGVCPLESLAREFLSPAREKAMDRALQLARGGSVVTLGGLAGSSVAALFAGMALRDTGKKPANGEKGNAPVLLVADSMDDAGYLYNDLVKILGDRAVMIFPSGYRRDIRYGQVDPPQQILRTETLSHWTTDPGLRFVVSYPEAMAEKVASRQRLTDKTATFAVGEEIDLAKTRKWLLDNGFLPVDYVYEPGHFAIRGSILDIFGYSGELPYRIDLFGDEIESIRSFNIETQLSEQKVESVAITANVSAEGDAGESLLDFIPPSTVIAATDLSRLTGRIEAIAADSFSSSAVIAGEGDMQAMKQLVDPAKFARRLAGFTRLEYTAATPPYESETSLDFGCSPQGLYHKNFDLISASFLKFLGEGYKIYILTDSQKQAQRLHAIFDEREEEIPFTPASATLHEGFVDHRLKRCLFTDHQIFDRFHKYSLKSDRARSGKLALSLKELSAIETGDYIVHVDHGVGKFGGLLRTQVNGTTQEMIKLIYKNNDCIFVSIHALHKLAKYRGKEGVEPTINKLGSGAWNRLKEKTKKKLKDIARDLIRLYAARKEEKGFSFSPDSYLQHELEASFIYEDTPDQLTATRDVKADMESDRPMDRLICGDVGFGKTEIAIRAAFKAATDGKQVAVLVPTTILALQHYRSFSERLRDFPVRVEYLNRTKTAKEAGQIRADLESGRIDILIGTHKILGKQIKFRDLGLLIIDEEQKFGVAAKEKLTQMAVNVDTLTLTATPIPRTLQFSLMGSRDLSVISTPPPNRQPIVTESHVFSEEIIRDAVEAELARGGQVYFVHNRVEDLMSIQGLITRVCPKARVAVGHGKMPAEKLEKLIMDFIYGEFDVLVSTTIIENGIDIPNANTIIVDNAQNFGLSDLHQLRGRVGRSNQKAYCYLLSPPEEMLSSDARRRLRAIEEFSDLGSGFNIAMQDLDIRGAGNLLGAEQSGFIADIGFETYQKIMNEAIAELRAEGLQVAGLGAAEQDVVEQMHYVDDAHIEIEVEAGLPDAYVAQQAERLKLYRELDSTKDEAALQAFESRLADRFGPLPREAQELLNVVRLRWEAIRLGIERVKVKNGLMILHFVGEQNSPYYKSDTFMELLRKVTQNPARFVLKQHNNRLAMTVRNVKDIEDGYKTLQQL